MNEGSGRSATASEASRVNGARSRGPRSEAGRQVAARNSLKHGLFRTGVGRTEALSPDVAALAGELDGFAAGGWQAGTLIEAAVGAASQLEQASALVRQVREQIAMLLTADVLDEDRLTLRVEELVRFGRYERRFRGRRDRALRKLMAMPAAQ